MARVTTGKSNPSYVIRARLDTQDRRITDLAKGLGPMVDAVELIGRRLDAVEKKIGVSNSTLRGTILERLDDIERQVSEIQYPTNPMEE